LIGNKYTVGLGARTLAVDLAATRDATRVEAKRLEGARCAHHGRAPMVFRCIHECNKWSRDRIKMVAR
jgi:hypothetical protein